jgi:hypothetical protein
VAAIAAAGASSRHEFLTPERQTAVTAVACFYGNDDFVYEHWKGMKLYAGGSKGEKAASQPPFEKWCEPSSSGLR